MRNGTSPHLANFGDEVDFFWRYLKTGATQETASRGGQCRQTWIHPQVSSLQFIVPLLPDSFVAFWPMPLKKSVNMKKNIQPLRLNICTVHQSLIYSIYVNLKVKPTVICYVYYVVKNVKFSSSFITLF
jgi:hypothetical protein